MNHTRNLAIAAVAAIGIFLFGYLGPKLVSANDTTSVIGGFILIIAFLYSVFTVIFDAISKRLKKETEKK
uniref:Membrane protein n=1 Tax=Ochrobactrum phage ORM_20 TaxID=2985243 RepID=A0A9N6WVG3_9VIRU|nr:membrane protein [Ochrobactrum phage ORM_20]